MDKLNSDLNAFIVPVEILTIKGLTIYEKMAYVVIRSFCNPRDNSAFPSYKTIAENGSMSRLTAIRAVQGLEEKGLLIKKTNLTVTAERKIMNATNTYNLVSVGDHPSICEIPPLVSVGDHPSICEIPYKDLKDLKDLKEIKRDLKEIDECLSSFTISDEQKEKIKQKILHNKTKIHNLYSYVEKLIANEPKQKSKRPDVKMVSFENDPVDIDDEKLKDILEWSKNREEVERVRLKVREYEKGLI
jgi:hypothetical protein